METSDIERDQQLFQEKDLIETNHLSPLSESNQLSHKPFGGNSPTPTPPLKLYWSLPQLPGPDTGHIYCFPNLKGLGDCGLRYFHPAIPNLWGARPDHGPASLDAQACQVQAVPARAGSPEPPHPSATSGVTEPTVAR
ncbi:hypothetical protein DSO57_1023378, partial [Entomophthora muscae]